MESGTNFARTIDRLAMYITECPKGEYNILRLSMQDLAKIRAALNIKHKDHGDINARLMAAEIERFEAD